MQTIARAAIPFALNRTMRFVTRLGGPTGDLTDSKEEAVSTYSLQFMSLSLAMQKGGTSLTKTLLHSGRLEPLEGGFENADSHVWLYHHASAAKERQLIRERIVNEHMGLLRFLAQRFMNRGETIEDLTQVAAVGLLGALERFDPGRGNTFISFARPSIVGELKRHFRDKTWAIRVPRALQQRSLEVVSTESELSQELGRRPTPFEIGERIGTSEGCVIESLAVARNYKAKSLDQPVEHDNEEIVALGELLAEDDGTMGKVEDRVTLGPIVANLSDYDKRILYMRFYQGLVQTDIAKELGVSQMQVSRKIARILGELRSRVVA